jgi:hypothetical protein
LTFKEKHRALTNRKQKEIRSTAIAYMGLFENVAGVAFRLKTHQNNILIYFLKIHF